MQKSTDRIARSCVAFLQWWGIGLKEDQEAAYKLLKAAAEAGSACAEYRMGEWHHAAKDKAGADYWFRRSIAGEEEPFPPAAAALRGEEPTTTIISATTLQNSTPEQNVCVKH